MEVLYNHFENLSKNNFDDGNIDIDIDVNNLSPEMDNILNSPITIEEIKTVFKIKHCVFRKLCMYKLRQLTHKLYIKSFGLYSVCE
jgi:hypothetical protein